MCCLLSLLSSALRLLETFRRPGIPRPLGGTARSASCCRQLLLPWVTGRRCLLLLQYKGQDGYCMANATRRVGRFKVRPAGMARRCPPRPRAPASPQPNRLMACARAALFPFSGRLARSVHLQLSRRPAATMQPQGALPVAPGVPTGRATTSAAAHTPPLASPWLHLCPPPQGYARVPRYNDAALREALLSRGPLAISFDASHPSFRFYSGGVYREERVRGGRLCAGRRAGPACSLQHCGTSGCVVCTGPVCSTPAAADR